MRFLIGILLLCIGQTAGSAAWPNFVAAATAWSATNANPMIVFSGDSTMSGWTNWSTSAFGEDVHAYDTNGNIANWVNVLSGGAVVCTNLAAAGRKWAGIRNYDFEAGGTEILQYKPRFLVLRVGVNNNSSGEDWTTDCLSDANWLRAACTSNGMRMILCSQLPFNGNVPAWNGYYDTWAATNNVQRLDDFELLHDGMGDLQAQYTFDTQHLTKLGVGTIATNFLNFMEALHTPKTITAYSAATNHVEDALWEALHGDTVSIPAGTVTYAHSVIVPTDRRIHISGAGTNSTRIIGTGSGPTFHAANDVWVSGIRFTNANTSAHGVKVAGGYGSRIFNNVFESANQSAGVIVAGADAGYHPLGVMYSNLCLGVNTIVNGGDVQAHNIWVAPNEYGSTNSGFYIEGNTIVGTIFNNAVDANYGGKYVFRHNTVIDLSLEAHSVQGGNRAAKSWEIYGNSIAQQDAGMNFAFYIRGGTGLIFSNAVTGTWSNPDGFINNVRSAEFRFGGGYPYDADGGSPWDGNLTNGIPEGATGTHTGANNASTLTDSGKSWSLGIFSEWPAQVATNRWIYNLTDGSSGQITTNTATTITATLAGGTDNDWDAGDEYKITLGYPARDQIGMGYDSSLSVGNALAAQVADMAYFWANTASGTPFSLRVSGAENTSLHIVEGRDFTNGIARPGYVPLVYPHPLVGGESEGGSGEPTATDQGKSTRRGKARKR